MKSPYKKIMILVICAIISASIFYGHLPSLESDSYGTLVVSQNIIQNHTLNLKAVEKYWEIPPGHYSYQIWVVNKDKAIYAYPLGTPIISIPFVYLANLSGLNMLKNELLVQEIICSVIAILIFLTIYSISNCYFSPFFSVILGLFGFYGTTIGTVVGTGLWDLDYDILFSGLTILMIFFSIKRNYSLKIQNFETSSLLTGIFLFLSFISRPTASVFAFFTLVFLFIYNRKYFTKTAIASGSLFIVYEIVLYKMTGSILNKGYNNLSQFGLENFVDALKGFFISPARGVIIFNPFLIFTLIGLYLLYKNKHRIDKRIVLLVSSILVSGFALSILLLFWKCWFGGWSYGPRIYADAIYWCFLATVIIWGEITAFRYIAFARTKGFKFIVVLFLFIGFFINLQGIYNQYALKWNALPDVGINRKILFDWRFPQFLMTKDSMQEKYEVQAREFGIEPHKTIFNKEHSAVQKFLSDGNQLSNLYPKYLEKHGYLDKAFGYQTGPANNWTQNGGWIGSWPCPDNKGKCFGIGVEGNIYDLNPIINKYKSQSLQIFFPYPKIYNANSKDSGQLFMIFRATPFTVSIPYTIDFTSKGNAGQFEQGGFCSPEAWGTWSCAKEISLNFDIKNTLQPLYMHLYFNALADNKHSQTFEFYLNNHLLGTKQYITNKMQNLYFDISKYVKEKNTLIIKVPDAASPQSLGINSDTRILGIGLIKINLTNKAKQTQ